MLVKIPALPSSRLSQCLDFCPLIKSDWLPPYWDSFTCNLFFYSLFEWDSMPVFQITCC